MTCPLCGHPEQAQIEAEFVNGTISANDIVAKIGSATIDILGVLVHMDEHESALSEEVERRKEFMTPILNGEEPSYKEYEDEPLPEISRKPAATIATLPALHQMYFILEQKLNKILAGKGISGMPTIVREMRETLKEINRVKKEQKASLSDRTEELFDEFDDLNDWLLFNLCDECRGNLEKTLAGDEKIQTISPERMEVFDSGKDRAEYRTDATDS